MTGHRINGYKSLYKWGTLLGYLYTESSLNHSTRTAQSGLGTPPGKGPRKERWMPHSFLRRLYPLLPRLECGRPRRDQPTSPTMESEHARDRHTTDGEPQRQSNTDGRGRHAKHGLPYYIQQAREHTDYVIELAEILDAHQRNLDPTELWGDPDE